MYLASDAKEHEQIWNRGGKSCRQVENAGVGFIVTKELHRSLIKIDQVSSRILVIELKTVPRTVVISAYAPQAGRDDEYKDRFYDQLEKTIEEVKKRKVLIIVGDFNARLHGRQEGEERIMGKWIAGRGEAYVTKMSTKTADNRYRFTSLAKGQNLYICNTKFEKPKKGFIYIQSNRYTGERPALRR